MRREDKIKHIAESYSWTGNQFDIEKAFIEGAKWADKHPKEGMVNLYKACEWLRNNIDFYVETKYDEDFRVDIEQLLNYFRKAMEE